MSGSRLEDELAKLRELVQELEDERAELTPSERLGRFVDELAARHGRRPELRLPPGGVGESDA